ncbi:MAG: 4-hydroxy-3-methylbut-2-enyl diphosphate reductase [Candidatus Fermentibacteraceae bacterium]|nr:4-hydroxy-3-methylbut-2-enyl diphosphate reductase [Candidatus Fermentibacteraceae bacterium]MBN2608726.1 4-hydroxy-3-methylbut-2-enyl diphosphate reductase [Candidatus Fermentibacteraceae bacterium]
MGVITARTAGFCWGVRRAVDMVLAALREGEDPYAIYGELVHNPQVLQALADRGVAVCVSPESMERGTLFLRTHGTTLEKRRELGELPLSIRDLTCPRVGRALAMARKKSEEGYDVIILGDPSHQEVRSIRSYGGAGARVITGPDDIGSLGDVRKPFLLSQTTQNTGTWERTRDRLAELYPDLEYCCTICNSTSLRQEELRMMCGRVDCVVVVGGRNSANTARLVEVAREEGLPAFHVETHDDLDPVELGKYENILLTAGASTPSWCIRKVRERLLELQGGRLRTGKVRRFLQNAIFGNFHVLPVTFTLGAAGACVLGLHDWLMPVLSSSLFLFAVHLVTSVLESGYSHPSGIGRQEFLRKHRSLLMTLSVTAFASSLAISVHLDPLWPLVLGLMLAAFLVYSIPLIRRVYPFRGLRALPGSRDLMFAGAWSFLLAFLPGYISSGIQAGTILWAGMLFFLFLGRCLLADLVDLQGDALMGMDTIPIHAGRAASVLLFWLCFAIASLLMFLGAVSGYLSRITLYSVPGLVSLAAGFIILGRVPFPSELSKRAMADGSLFLAGCVPAVILLSGVI